MRLSRPPPSRAPAVCVCLFLQGGRRVVVTGMGIVSCLGNTLEDVTTSLKECKSGIKFNPKYE